MIIQVKLISAVLTRDTQLFSNMDPYCLLSIGSQRYRSRTRDEAGKKPVWNQTFKFNRQDNILKVVVMDQDTLQDDIVGEGTVDISKYRTNLAQNQQICRIFYKGKDAGRVLLRVSGANFAQQPNNFGQQGANNWGNNQYGGQVPYGQMQNNPYGNQGYNQNYQPPYQPQYQQNYQQQYPQQYNQYPQQPNNGQWGNLNTNNGWGNFFQKNPPPNNQNFGNNNNMPNNNVNNGNFNGNLYPQISDPKAPNYQNNNANPMNLLGNYLTQQNNINKPPPPQNNPNLPYELVNGMAGLINKNQPYNQNNNYGKNPYS